MRSGLITHPDKVLFAERGETKGDLAGHYLRVAEPLMRTMGGRPVLLQRFPEGADGPSFFQKRVPGNVPDWLQTTTVSTPNGTTSRALVAADLDHVLWAVNLGCLGFHVWPYLAADPDHADELRIDLDPTPGVDFTHIRQAARQLQVLLAELGITGYPKTTGSRGLHVYVRLQPRWDSYQVRAPAVAAARELERRRPDLITAAWWKEERGSRVFVDYNQNAPHKTVFGEWSVRARPGAQVSTPVGWDELDDIHPDQFTIAALAGRLETAGDPWLRMSDDPQSLQPLLAMSARDRESGMLDAPWPPVYPQQPGEPPPAAPGSPDATLHDARCLSAVSALSQRGGFASPDASAAARGWLLRGGRGEMQKYAGQGYRMIRLRPSCSAKSLKSLTLRVASGRPWVWLHAASVEDRTVHG